MDWFSLLGIAVQAQETDPSGTGGYVPPVVEVAPIVIERTPWLDIYDSFLFGLKEGGYLAAQIIPILAVFLSVYATVRWMNRRFRTVTAASGGDRATMISNTGDLLFLGKADGVTGTGILVINIPEKTQEREQRTMPLPMEEGRLIAETSGGTVIELAAGEGQRVLHALVTLAQTPVAPHITVAAVRTPQGVELWRGTSAGAAQ